MSKKSLPRQKFLAILACFFFSGAAGLIYQVAWGKALGLIFGHTVYAIATVLAVFMAGLAAGSAWLGGWNEPRTQPVRPHCSIPPARATTRPRSLVGLPRGPKLYLPAFSPPSRSNTPLLG